MVGVSSVYPSFVQCASAAFANPNAVPSANTPAGERPSPSAFTGPATGGTSAGSHAVPLFPTTIAIGAPPPTRAGVHGPVPARS